MRGSVLKMKSHNPPREAKAAQPAPFPIVGIGASAGGLEAFSELLHGLPQKTGMAYALVQHLDPKHSSVLQEILARTTKIPVSEVTDGVVVEPDHVYVIPANTDLEIKNGALRLGARMLTRGQHMPINHFLYSLAAEAGERAIGVILSGTASDGTDGCGAIKAAGGITFAQDEESAKYSSMPRSAVGAGHVDFVLSPKEIAKELARIGQHPYITTLPSAAKEAADLAVGNDLETLFFLLSKSTGVDFTYYKHSTLQRRIRRRMVLHKIEKLKEYLAYIKKAPSELDELYRDLLIHVTGFFREPGAFEALRKRVLPVLFEARKPSDPIRVWVPGCSTGEEVYSIAITLLEHLWVQTRNLSQAATTIQIFATDISSTALDRARAGLYTEAAVAGVSAERLKRFFVRLDGGYQINKSIREMCVFAEQNIAKDPPFSSLDLISCRNLLIYLGPVLQRRVIPTLHYALKPNAYLMLGTSESLGTFGDYFTLVDRKSKIYQKKKTLAQVAPYIGSIDYSARRGEEARILNEAPAASSVEKEAQRLLVDRFVPASIVVNDKMEIVQFQGRTGAYLEPASGHPTFSLSRMVREGLLVDLRSALSEAKKQNAPARREGVHIQSDGSTKEVNLEVVPMRGSSARERFYLVVFQDGPPAGAEEGKAQRGRTVKAIHSTARQNERLNREMAQLRDQLKALLQEHETTTEEFKSANEEVLSANEELQSTNEELETAKEELQSSNEELTTLNEEMQNRNAELTSVNNDLLNLLGNVNIPVVMVGNDLRIRRFTPLAQKVMNLLPGDIGRRLGEIRPNLEVQDLEALAGEAVQSVSPQELEVRSNEGKWHLMRVRPYKTWDNKIEGAVISLQDIDVLKRTLEQTRDYADTLVENARKAILALDGNLRITGANPSFYRIFEVSLEETENRLIYELGNGQWNIPRLRVLLEDIIPKNTRVDDFEVEHNFPRLGPRVMLLNARRIDFHQGRQLILLAIEDVTEQRCLEALQKKQTTLLELIPGAVMGRGVDGTIQFWSRGAEKMYGWSRDASLGQSSFELLRTEFPQPLKDIEAQLARTGHWEGDLMHTRHDGTRIPVHSRWALEQKATEGAPQVLEINFENPANKNAKKTARSRRAG